MVKEQITGQGTIGNECDCAYNKEKLEKRTVEAIYRIPSISTKETSRLLKVSEITIWDLVMQLALEGRIKVYREPSSMLCYPAVFRQDNMDAKCILCQNAREANCTDENGNPLDNVLVCTQYHHTLEKGIPCGAYARRCLA